MAEHEVTTWLLKPGNHGEIESAFIGKGIIGIDVHIGDNFRYFDNRKELKLFLEKRLPIMKKKPRQIGEIFAITAEMKQDDYVLLPNVADPHIVHLGKILGDYVYDPLTQYSFSRPVIWYCKIGRDRLSNKLKNSFNTNYSLTDIHVTALLEDFMANRHLLGT